MDNLCLFIVENMYSHKEGSIRVTSSEIQNINNHTYVESLIKINSLLILWNLTWAATTMRLWRVFFKQNFFKIFLAYLLCEIKIPYSICFTWKPRKYVSSTTMLISISTCICWTIWSTILLHITYKTISLVYI